MTLRNGTPNGSTLGGGGGVPRRMLLCLTLLATISGCARELGKEANLPSPGPRFTLASRPFDGWIRTASDVFVARLAGVTRDDPFVSDKRIAFRELTVEILDVIKGNSRVGATITVLNPNTFGEAAWLTVEDVGTIHLFTASHLINVKAPDGSALYRDVLAYVSQASYSQSTIDGEVMGVRHFSPHAGEFGGYGSGRDEIASRMNAQKSVRAVDGMRWQVLIDHARSPREGEDQLGYEEAGRSAA